LSTLIKRRKIPISFLNQLKYSPFLVQIVPTRRCNLKCGYCNEYDQVSRPVETTVIKERIQKIWELGTIAIEFSGGEPLLHPDIISLVQYSTDLGFFARMLITNGFLLTKEIILRLNQAGLTHLQISIDGVEPTEMTQKVLSKLKEKLILAAKYAKFKVVINTVVGAAPPKEVLQVIRFTKDTLGFIPRVLVLHDDEGQVKLTPEDLSVYHEIKKHVKKRLFHSSSDTDKQIEGKDTFFKCRAGSRYLYVDEHGMVSWCSQQREEWQKKLSDYTLDDLKEQFYTVKSCEQNCTIGCVKTCSKYDKLRSYG